MKRFNLAKPILVPFFVLIVLGYAQILIIAGALTKPAELRFQHKIFHNVPALVASELSEEVGNREDSAALRRLRIFHPELKPYIVGSDGQVLYPKAVPNRITLDTKVAVQSMETISYGVDPELPNKISMFLASPIPGTTEFLYLIVKSRLGDGLNSEQEFRAFIVKLAKRFSPYVILLLLACLIFTVRIVRSIRRIQWLLELHLRGDLTQKWESKNRFLSIFKKAFDDIDNVGSGLQELASEVVRLKQVTELKERKRRDTILAIVHDVRGPLTGMKASIESALQKFRAGALEIDPKLIEVIQLGVNSVKKYALSLIAASENIESLKEIHTETFDLSTVVRELILQLQNKAQLAQLRLSFSDQNNVMAFGDKDALERVLLNLIENAIKHTLPGGEIQVQLAETEREVMVTVKDTGVGISPDELLHIFEPFHRGTVNQLTEGTGIGLTIAQNIVKQHGSQIIARSKVGEGTEFQFEVQKCFNTTVTERSVDPSSPEKPYDSSINYRLPTKLLIGCSLIISLLAWAIANSSILRTVLALLFFATISLLLISSLRQFLSFGTSEEKDKNPRQSIVVGLLVFFSILYMPMNNFTVASSLWLTIASAIAMLAFYSTQNQYVRFVIILQLMLAVDFWTQSTPKFSFGLGAVAVGIIIGSHYLLAQKLSRSFFRFIISCAAIGIPGVVVCCFMLHVSWEDEFNQPQVDLVGYTTGIASEIQKIINDIFISDSGDVVSEASQKLSLLHSYSTKADFCLDLPKVVSTELHNVFSFASNYSCPKAPLKNGSFLRRVFSSPRTAMAFQSDISTPFGNRRLTIMLKTISTSVALGQITLLFDGIFVILCVILGVLFLGLIEHYGAGPFEKTLTEFRNTLASFREFGLAHEITIPPSPVLMPIAVAMRSLFEQTENVRKEIELSDMALKQMATLSGQEYLLFAENIEQNLTELRHSDSNNISCVECCKRIQNLISAETVLTSALFLLAKQNLVTSTSSATGGYLEDMVDEAVTELVGIAFVRQVEVIVESDTSKWIDGDSIIWRALIYSLLDGIVKEVVPKSEIHVCLVGLPRNEILRIDFTLPESSKKDDSVGGKVSVTSKTIHLVKNSMDSEEVVPGDWRSFDGLFAPVINMGQFLAVDLAKLLGLRLYLLPKVVAGKTSFLQQV